MSLELSSPGAPAGHARHHEARANQPARAGARLEGLQVVADAGAADAGVALHLKVVAQGAHDLQNTAGCHLCAAALEFAEEKAPPLRVPSRSAAQARAWDRGRAPGSRGGCSRAAGASRRQREITSAPQSSADAKRYAPGGEYQRRRWQSCQSRTGPAESRRSRGRTARYPSAGSQTASRNLAGGE